MSPHTPARTRATLLGLFAASLTACGGGGGDNTPAPTPPVAAVPAPPAASAPAPAPSPAPAPAPAPLAAISGTVADGPLAGAVVCYDLNDNSNCDAGEPTSGPTDANGRYRIEIDPSFAGKHRVVAIVPAGAIDKDTGVAVGTAFTLVAPATAVAGSQTIFVSPLTSLVQTQIDTTGQTTEQASSLIRTQAGLAVSPLADFTAGADAAQQKAATVARLALLTMNQQTNALSGVLGQTDLSGTTVTEQQLQQVVMRALLGALPALAASASDAAVREAATPANREAALAKAAQTLVTSQLGLTAETARLAAGIAKLPLDTTNETPKATAALAAFSYRNAEDWYYRALLATTADNTPDANGRLHYYDQRVQRLAGQTTTWAYASTPARAGDLHWSGTAWVACAFGTRSEQTPIDSSGRGAYAYCGSGESGFRSRSTVDIAGRSLRDVIGTIRQAPGGFSGVNYADWGPTDLNLLGNATMPAGATLSYQTNTLLASSATYDPTAGSVNVFSEAVSAGGDARTDASLACNLTANSAPAASLEELIARSPGRPCIFNPSAASGPKNEWWSNSTASLGTIDNAATPPEGTGSEYTRTATLRVAFVAGSAAVNFYACLQRASSGSSRNCNLIGTGTYRIETVGDARTIEFENFPELTQRLTYRRVFVERGGKVYFGFRTPVGRVTSSVRLNLPATNALFTQLGLPELNPVD